jgi:hypothetical protein
MSRRHLEPVLPYYHFISGDTRTANRMVLQEHDYELVSSLRASTLQEYWRSGSMEFLKRSIMPMIDFAASRDDVVDDMPWFPSLPVVSAPLREILQTAEPESLVFSDCRVFHKEKVWMPKGRYFVVWATRVVVCHDEHRTTWRQGEAKRVADKFFLDVDRVPSSAHVFRPLGRERTTFISHLVRERMDAADMKRCSYFPPDDLVPLW